MEADNEKGKFPTKKDLSYWIIILILSIIVIVTNNYGSNEELVSHVGFGGTIISIVLAVIAIIYSFYQSSTYENTTHKLDSSAQKIEEATKKLSDVSAIKNVVDDFAKDVDAIDLSISELKELISTIDAGVNVISKDVKKQRELLSTINAFNQGDNNKSSNQNDTIIMDDALTKEYFKKVLFNGGILTYYCFYIINKAVKENIKTVDILKFNKVYLQEVLMLDNSDEQEVNSSLLGVVVGALKAYTQAGFIDIGFKEDDKMEVKMINQKLSEVVEEEFNIMMERKEQYRQGFLQVDEEFKKNK